MEWGKLVKNLCESVRRLKIDNRRTRILTEDEQKRLLAAAPHKTRTIITLALLTGARIGELLELTWANVGDDVLRFLHTKNGKERRIPLSPSVKAVLHALPKSGAYVFMNARTEEAYTPNGVRHVFNRAVRRAKLDRPEEITPHTLRHTALSQMIGAGHSDHSVKAISGHSTTRMLERYVHPNQALKIAALETGAYVVTTWTNRKWHRCHRSGPRGFAGICGGRQEDRTPDLSVANAALSQLS